MAHVFPASDSTTILSRMQSSPDGCPWAWLCTTTDEPPESLRRPWIRRLVRDRPERRSRAPLRGRSAGAGWALRSGGALGGGCRPGGAWGRRGDIHPGLRPGLSSGGSRWGLGGNSEVAGGAWGCSVGPLRHSRSLVTPPPRAAGEGGSWVAESLGWLLAGREMGRGAGMVLGVASKSQGRLRWLGAGRGVVPYAPSVTRRAS